MQLHANKIIRYFLYVRFLCNLIRKEKFDFVFQVDHKLTLLIRLLNLNQKFILYFRTGGLNKKFIVRSFNNLHILFTSLFCKNISIISESLSVLLHIPLRKVIILHFWGNFPGISIK